MKLYDICHDYLTPPDQGINPEEVIASLSVQPAEILVSQMLADESWHDASKFTHEQILSAMSSARADLLQTAYQMQTTD